MEFAKLKDEMLTTEESPNAVLPVTQLQELELVLVGGGMGDVQQ